MGFANKRHCPVLRQPSRPVAASGQALLRRPATERVCLRGGYAKEVFASYTACNLDLFSGLSRLRV